MTNWKGIHEKRTTKETMTKERQHEKGDMQIKKDTYKEMVNEKQADRNNTQTQRKNDGKKNKQEFKKGRRTT